MLGVRYIILLSVILLCSFCKKPDEGKQEAPGEKPNPENPATEHLIGKTFSWDNITIGGGGYVTGIAIHPVYSDRMYIRTDVGGAYRWDTSAAKWIQLLNGMDNAQMIGVDGIALDANKPDRIYLAIGKSSRSDGGLFRSDDGGNTWQKIFTARFGGNETLRWIGECVAVDPLSSRVIYCGTRTDGLFCSTDEGYSWRKLTGVPSGSDGVRTIAIDSSSIINNHSAIVYAGIPGSGIYRSTDGGDTFAGMAGAPDSPNRMECAGGKLFVTHSKGVAMWNGLSWKDITPSASVNKNYCGLATDPGNFLKIAVAHKYYTFNNPIFRSSNGGESWEQLNTSTVPVRKFVDVPWWPSNWFSNATAAMVFDPHNAGKLYYTVWFGIWYTPDMWSPTVDWHTMEQGHEETVVLTLAAPTGEALLYSGVCDVFAFRHTSLFEYPERLGNNLNGVNNCFSIAFCEKLPRNLAFVASKGDDGSGTTIKVSSDGGQNWTDCAVPEHSRLGRIAISATDPRKMVYLGGGTNGAVFYSADTGRSWMRSNGAPVGAAGSAPDDVWNKDFPLIADCVNGSRFYLFMDGILYATSDGGANWSAQNSTPIPKQNRFLFVAARPGKEGEVWISLHNNGLYKTIDGGRTLTKVDKFSNSQVFAWGAPAPNSDVATAYCYGTFEGVTGMYGSTTLGKTWVKVNDNSQKFPSDVKCLAGDRLSFGRIFVGTGGQGVLYSKF